MILKGDDKMKRLMLTICALAALSASAETRTWLANVDGNWNRRVSSAWVKKADYFKLSNLQIGYTFDKKALKSKIGLQSLTLYLTGNNLLYFTDLLSGNPEMTSFTMGAYPLMRTLQFGLKVGF